MRWEGVRERVRSGWGGRARGWKGVGWGGGNGGGRGWEKEGAGCWGFSTSVVSLGNLITLRC